MSRRKKIELFFGTLVLVGAIFAVGFFGQPQASSNGLEVAFLDVGQGDAAYIKTPSGQDILIDGGPDSSVLSELAKVMSFSDREINLVILSHPHADHLTGLVEVLKRYQVDEVWETGVSYPSATYDKFHQIIDNNQIPDRRVKAGDEINFGQVKISILYPLSSLENQTIDNVNNASIVNRLDYNRFSVLFCGDAEKSVQQQLLKSNLFATVLKVAHHGSENGTFKEFDQIVRPAVAIISVGKNNKYGHPHAAALQILKDLAIRYYRTDQDGRIEITSDGQNYHVTTGN